MAFVALDGFHALIIGRVSSSDLNVMLSPRAVGRLRNMAANDYSYLILDDGVNREVVRYTATGTDFMTERGRVVVPLTRGLDGIQYNYGMRPTLSYGFCTQIVYEVANILKQQGSL